jgi:pimeloyl-ACP methyl ester carboxylesterase
MSSAHAQLGLIGLLPFLLAVGGAHPTAAGRAQLIEERVVGCEPSAINCRNFDALVFVHGVFGSYATFRNSGSGFYWPQHVPNEINGRVIDVYRLDYRTHLFESDSDTSNLETVMQDIFFALQPLRSRQYRSIGFIAHSLGGIIVASYLVHVKQSRGTPALSQHAYTISLGTPYNGASVATLGRLAKLTLGKRDDLLEALETRNVLLQSLNVYTRVFPQRQHLYDCRPSRLHIAVETKPYRGVEVISRSHWEYFQRKSQNEMKAFPLNHSSIAKPRGSNDPVFTWVQEILDQEFERLAIWDKYVTQLDPRFWMCSKIEYVPE